MYSIRRIEYIVLIFLKVKPSYSCQSVASRRTRGPIDNISFVPLSGILEIIYYIEPSVAVAIAHMFAVPAQSRQDHRPLSRRLDRCDRVIQNESRDPFGGNVYYVTMQITSLTRKFRNGERNFHCDIAHITTKWVSNLTLDFNGVFAIKAYGECHSNVYDPKQTFPPEGRLCRDCLFLDAINALQRPNVMLASRCAWVFSCVLIFIPKFLYMVSFSEKTRLSPFSLLIANGNVG